MVNQVHVSNGSQRGADLSGGNITDCFIRCQKGKVWGHVLPSVQALIWLPLQSVKSKLPHTLTRHAVFNTTSSCNGGFTFHNFSPDERKRDVFLFIWFHTATIYEPTFPHKSQAGLILLGTVSGPGSTLFHGSERLTKCKSKYFYTWGMMAEINHCWTLWTSLLQQVPHGVNLFFFFPQTEVVASFGIRIHGWIIAKLEFSARTGKAR